MNPRRFEISALAVATVTVVAITAAATAGGTVISYAAASDSAAWIHGMAGVSMIGAGWAAASVRPTSRLAWLSVLTAATWFATDWIGWNGPAPIRTSGMVLAPLTVVALALMAVALTPTGQFPRIVYNAIALGSGLALVVNVARLAVYDPLFDLDCWNNCTDNSLLIDRNPALADTLATVIAINAFVVGVVAAAGATYWLIRASERARRDNAVVVAPVIAALLATASVAGFRALGWSEHPDVRVFAVVHRLHGLTLLLLAAGIALTLAERVRARRAISALSRSIDNLGSDTSLERVLAATTADSQLRIGYWIEHPGRLVDVDGRPLDLTSDPDLITTSIVRNGEPIALVAQSHARADRNDLARQLGPTIRLAMDNERLRAASLAQIAELRESQARIVATADLARRRIERDLHDGAQQRLLAASFATRLAATQARDDGDDEAAASIDHLIDEIQRALDELRIVAHGIHPAELTTAGLRTAIRTLATSAEIPVEIVTGHDHRLSTSVEAAAYVTVADTVELLAEHGATYAQVAIDLADDELIIAIEHDTTLDPSTLIDVTDRIGAVGGRLDIDDHLIHARCPCAS